MKVQNHQLIAYLATLAALVVVFTIAMLTGAFSPGVLGKMEAFQLGTVTGGLIGLLRLPQRQTADLPTTTEEK